MIIDKHLAIVRAALLFFVEEMGSHGSAFEMYLDGEAMDLGIQNSDLKQTRDLFGNVVTRKVMLDTESNRLANKQHFACKDADQTAPPAKRIVYVTLLVPREFVG